MSPPDRIPLKPIPSLAEWIGDGARAGGFEEWTFEALQAEAEVGTPHQKAMVRLIKIFSVAAVEAGRIETMRYDRSYPDTISFLARAAGVAIAAAVLSACDETAEKLDVLLEEIASEFRLGAAEMIERATR